MIPLGGLSVAMSEALPRVPTDGENARRMVRHGLADVLEWLGEDVGPAPGDQTEMVRVGSLLLVSQRVGDQMTRMRFGIGSTC